MVEPVETFEHAGLLVAVHYDEDGESANPRNADNFGTLAFEYGVNSGLDDERLGGEEALRHLQIVCSDCGGSGYKLNAEGDDVDCARCAGDGYIDATIEEYFEEKFDAIVTLPIHYGDYGSSGARINSCEEAEANGVIFATKASAEMTGVPKAKYVEALEVEIDVLNTWLEGGVYGYVVREFEGGKVLDSCWGFLAKYLDTTDEGGWGYLIDEAKRAAVDQAEILKNTVREIVTFEVKMQVPFHSDDKFIPSADEIKKALYDGTDIDTPSAITVKRVIGANP